MFLKTILSLFNKKSKDPVYAKQGEQTFFEVPPLTSLTLNDYQLQAFTVAKYPECGTGSLMAVVYCGLGLGEAGETQGKIKKILRDFGGQITPETKESLVKEMGDQLWYIASLATELGVTLEDIAKKNLDKLLDRKKRGVIGGSGDNR